VYWKGLEPSELLEYDSRHVAFTQELPFQEGKPLSSISKEEEGSTELLQYSHTADNSPDCQVYMASLSNADDDKPGPEYNAELLADVSADESTADAPQDKNEEHRRIRRLKNAKAPSVGGTWKTVLTTQCTKGTSTTLLQQQRIGSIVHRLASLQKQRS
jgi:hypothetical protein